MVFPLPSFSTQPETGAEPQRRGHARVLRTLGTFLGRGWRGVAHPSPFWIPGKEEKMMAAILGVRSFFRFEELLFDKTMPPPPSALLPIHTPTQSGEVPVTPNSFLGSPPPTPPPPPPRPPLTETISPPSGTSKFSTAMRYKSTSCGRPLKRLNRWADPGPQRKRTAGGRRSLDGGKPLDGQKMVGKEKLSWWETPFLVGILFWWEPPFWWEAPFLVGNPERCKTF